MCLVRLVFVTGVYYLAATLSRNFAFPAGIVGPLWLPSAIALCACLAWGMRAAPAVWAGALLGFLSAGLPASSAALIGIGAALEACVACLLVRRFHRTRLDFIDRENIFKLIGIATASAMIGASAGVAGLALAGRQALVESGIIWWLGDATGMLVGVPLILAWRTRIRLPPVQWNAGRMAEAATLALLLPTVTFLALGDAFGSLPLAFLPLPLVLWAAFRFNLPAVASAIAVIYAITVWNTVNGKGPFARGDLNSALSLMGIYVGVTSATGLALARLMRQQRQAQRMLKTERDNLERRVRSRTDALTEDIEQRKRIERQLATREKQLAEAQQLAQIGSWNWEPGSGAIIWSDELYRICGVSKESFEVTPDSCRMLIHEKDVDNLQRAVSTSHETGQAFHVEYRIVQPGGATRIVAARGQRSLDDCGGVVRMFGTVQDITEARLAEASLREAEERYRKVVELSPDAILVQQDGVFVFANPAAMALLGANSMEQIIGRSLFDFLHEDFHALVRERIACLQSGKKLPSIEEKFVRMDGRVVAIEVNSSPFVHEGKPASLFIMRDITERKKTAEQMVYLAHYDSLTGLPNRMLFHQRLEHALTIAERPGRSLEILFLDLDRFKNINDTLGHATGDIVLQEAAVRLRGILRESDTVARLGGDEFVVLVENVDEPHRGGIIADKILAAFAPPFLLGSTPLAISTSIGISSFPSDGTDADTLLKKADIAMYRAKETGRNNYRYYSPEINLHTAERLSFEYALKHALEQNQLSLYYQPKIDVVSNRISSMEALLRWRHPTLGLVPPHQFIPVAEENGLIKPIGYWAIRTACLQNKHWQESGLAPLKVAVNLSPRQLSDDNLIDNIDAILRDTNLESRYLELEITESAVMANPEKAILVLHTLCERGISVAIDDFGIGYSSLAYLKQFPIRAVKIDRSFVQGIPFNHGDAAITKAIIGLAHSLECSVIAEGAETKQQYDFLREHECDSIQGYYFSEPMPAEHFEDLIKVQTKLHL